MAYSSRFGCTSAYNRCKHDPATHGMFIHGGTCISGPFYNRNARNRFSVTIPCNNKMDQEIDLAGLYQKINNRRFPTFQKAFDFALKMRAETPSLRYCPIFSCCEMIMETTYSGHMGVQLLSWPDVTWKHLNMVRCVESSKQKIEVAA